jgi:hypothetical protein
MRSGKIGQNREVIMVKFMRIYHPGRMGTHGEVIAIDREDDGMLWVRLTHPRHGGRSGFITKEYIASVNEIKEDWPCSR